MNYEENINRKRPPPFSASCIVSAEKADEKTHEDNTVELESHLPKNNDKNFAKYAAKKGNKKLKKRSSSSEEDISKVSIETLESSLAPLKETMITSPTNYALSYDKFHEFLAKAYGKTNIVEISLEYTQNTEELIKMLDLSYPLLLDKSIKARCARIKKKLMKHVMSTSESDSSQKND